MKTLPDVAPLLQTAFAFWSSKVLLTAVELGLFTRLADRRLSAEELGGELELHPRGALDFLDALVALRFLERAGDGPDARYHNNALGRLYLDQASPRYVGALLHTLEERQFRTWNDLPEVLRTGRPRSGARRGRKGLFEALHAELPRLEAFMGAMTCLSHLNIDAFAERFDFTRYRTLCDVGGATGLLCVEVARRHPHLECISFDLPLVEPIAEQFIASQGLGARVCARSGDFFRDPLPEADVITMGQILHDWNLEQKRHLIASAYRALPPGGALVAIEALIDDARRQNVFGLLMSLNMLLEYGDAFDFSAADFRGWCGEAGFRRFEVLPLAGPASAAIAYK